MNDIETVALTKALSKLEVEKIPAGKHKIDLTVTLRLTGSLTKKEDQDFTPTVSIPLKQALALVLHYAGVTREAAKSILVQAMTESLNGENTSIGDYLQDIDAAMAHVQSVTEALPQQTRSGATLTNLNLVEVEEPVFA